MVGQQEENVVVLFGLWNLEFTFFKGAHQNLSAEVDGSNRIAL